MKGSIRRKKNRSSRPKSVMLDSEMVTIIVYYVVFHIIFIITYTQQSYPQKWKVRTYFYKPETEEVWLQRVHDGRIFFCNITTSIVIVAKYYGNYYLQYNITDALSWKLPGAGEQSPSGPDPAGLEVDPIEVLVHQSQIEEYIRTRKVKQHNVQSGLCQ